MTHAGSCARTACSTPRASSLLQTAMDELGLSARRTTASCAWPGPSPTWRAANDIKAAHLIEAIGYRSLDRKLWTR